MKDCQFELYSLKTEYSNIIITFSIEDKIVIYGCESGDMVRKITGNFDYEYYLTINRLNMIQLKLMKGLKSFEELKEFFIKNFSGENCIEEVKKFCFRNFIRYEFSVWR